MDACIFFKKLLSMVLVGLLTACGGGGGGSGPPAAGTPTPAADSPTATPTVLASAYVGTVNSQGFWAVVASGQNGLELLAMNYNDVALSGVLYSGNVLAGVNGGAAASGLRTMRADGNVRDGTASISGASLTGFVASFDANTEDAAIHQAMAVLPVDSLAGDWTGRWADGLRRNSTLALTGLAAGGKIFISPLANCPDVALSLDALPATPGLYRVQLKYPNNEQCFDRNNRTLNGLAVVHVTGGQQQLRLVAVDSAGSGSGISFVGRRPLP